MPIEEDIEALANSTTMWAIIWDDLPFNVEINKYIKRADNITKNILNKKTQRHKFYEKFPWHTPKNFNVTWVKRKLKDELNALH